MLQKRAIKIHSLQEKLKAATGARLRSLPAPVLIGVSGGELSGKKTFCKGLGSLFEADGALFLQEALYRQNHLNNHTLTSHLDSSHMESPLDFDFAMLAHHLEGLFAGNPILIPHYDEETNSRASTWRVVTPSPIVVIEGQFLFEDPQLVGRMDFKVFIDTPLETRIERLCTQHSKLSTPSSVHPSPQVAKERLLPINELYIEPQRRIADVVISGEAPFEASLIDLGARVFDEVFARRRK